MKRVEGVSQEATSLTTATVLGPNSSKIALCGTIHRDAGSNSTSRMCSVDQPHRCILSSYSPKRGSALDLLPPLCGSSSRAQSACQASSEVLSILTPSLFLAALG